jgi:hypothetical protein
MTIALPSTPYWRKARPEFLDMGVDQAPSTGLGVDQRLERLGSRWALTVELPLVREGPAWLDWQVAMLQARSQGASYPWPQPGLITNTPSPGSPVIAGAGQTGSTLNISGVGFGYQVRKGQFLSVTKGARSYLHQCMALTSASAGAMAVPIYPMLRASPDNGSAVELVAPLIVGKITFENLSWDHEAHPFLWPKFRIAERA